jgi:ATP synthase protein I
MEPENKPTEKSTQESQAAKPYLKYSGLAFQMIGIMVLAALGGRKLDAYFGNDTPWWTLGLLLVAIAASMYLVIVSLTKKD